jgi:hypothetical protein
MRKIPRVLLASISLLFSLGAAEALVRIAAPQQLVQFRPDIWMPVDTLGWTFRPNVSARINTGEGWAVIYTDERGFRVGEGGAIQANRRVALIGDSFMAAIQVDHEKTVAGLMEADLAETLREPVAVWNTAVPSWDPPHYLIRARQLLQIDDQVDLLLVAVYLGNDIVGWNREAFAPRNPAPRPQFRVPRRWSSNEWIETLVRPMDSVLRQRSHLYVMARSSTTTLRMRLGLSSSRFPEEYLLSEADSPRWNNTADILEAIEKTAKHRGVPVLFVLIPPRFQVHEQMLNRHVRAFGIDRTEIRIDQPNELLGARLRDRGLRVLDPTQALRQAVMEGARPYGTVDAHFSAEGHAITWASIRGEVVGLLQDEM